MMKVLIWLLAVPIVILSVVVAIPAYLLNEAVRGVNRLIEILVEELRKERTR